MDMKDTATVYGAVSRINHWLGALLVIAILAIGIYFHEMPRGDERLYWMRLHVGIGMLAFLPLLLRIAWRLGSRSPEPLAQAPVLQWFTHAVHVALLGLLALLLVTGPFMVWSAGRPIEVFGLLSLPSPIGEWPALHELLEGVHAVAGKVIIPLIAVHVAGALKHLWFDRDRALGRMIGSPAQGD